MWPMGLLFFNLQSDIHNLIHEWHKEHVMSRKIEWMSYIRWTSINLDRLRYIHQYILVFSGICRREPNPCWNWRISSAVALWKMDASHSTVLCVYSTTVQPGFFHEYVFNFNPSIYLEDLFIFISPKYIEALDFTVFTYASSMMVVRQSLRFIYNLYFPSLKKFSRKLVWKSTICRYLSMFLLRKRRKRDIPTKSTCWMGRGGGVSRSPLLTTSTE